MACLALSLQNVQGQDLLLQTRQWFPPVRAAAAATSFKEKRKFSTEGGAEGLGDDAMAAASGQVVVGTDSKYRVVYRLVNTIYVLGISSADEDDASNNIFDCTNTVNRAVYVLVAACRGVDVTTEKLLRKYSDVYLALSAVLQGTTSMKLQVIISAVAGSQDSASQGGVLAVLTELKSPQARGNGKESPWVEARKQTMERQACVEVLAKMSFEIPPECVVAGDEAAVALGPPQQQSSLTPQVTPTAPKGGDPFAASASLEDDDFGALFGKRHQRRDSMAALLELEGGHIAGGRALMGADGFGMGDGFTGGLGGLEEGFEGDYGSLDLGDADDAFGGGFGDAFDSTGDAFGGGFDASEFGASFDADSGLDTDLGDLGELVIGSGARAVEAPGGLAKTGGDPFPQPTSPEFNRSDSRGMFDTGFGMTLVPAPSSGADMGSTDGAVESSTATRAALVWMEEVVHAEFRGVELVRVGLQGEIHLRPSPPSMMGGVADTELSFRLEGTAGVKRAVMNNVLVSSVGEGTFYVRAPPSEKSSCLLKYRLLPRFTPLPLRIRLVSKVIGDSVAWMLQYVANPYLFSELTNVKFCVAVPFPVKTQLLQMSPRGVWDPKMKEVQWKVDHIVPGAKPERLRARLEDPTVAREAQSELDHMRARVEFEWMGQNTLSGVTVKPASPVDGATGFVLGKNTIKTGSFICC